MIVAFFLPELDLVLVFVLDGRGVGARVVISAMCSLVLGSGDLGEVLISVEVAVDLDKGGRREGERELRMGDFLRFLLCLDFGGVDAEAAGSGGSERAEALRVVGGEDCDLGVFAMVCVNVVLCEKRVCDMGVLLL